MSQVSIKISGLALCHPNVGSALDVLFLHSTNHQGKDGHYLTLKLTVINRGVRTERKFDLGADNKILLDTDRCIPQAPRGDIDFAYVVNFDELHDEELKLRENAKLSISYLSIPNARTAAEVDRKEYEFWKNYGDTKTKIQKDPQVGKSVVCNFEIEEHQSLSINIEKPYPFSLFLPFQDETDYELEFDNTCHGDDCRDNDYPFYYLLLDPNPSGSSESFIVDIESSHKTLEDLKFFTDQQACNAGSGGGLCDFGYYYDNGVCRPIE